MKTYESVLSFWFGSYEDDAATAEAKRSLWFSKDPGTDMEVAKLFEKTVFALHGEKLKEWEESPRSLLALIIVADQFPRNIYRGTSASFAFDEKALGFSLRSLARGFDKEVRPLERAFIYFPFEHAESANMQDKSVKLFTSLLNEAGDGGKEVFESFLDYAIRHKEIIDRFGRFPHRNKILGRISTPEELAFLKTHGSKF